MTSRSTEQCVVMVLFKRTLAQELSSLDRVQYLLKLKKECAILSLLTVVLVQCLWRIDIFTVADIHGISSY